MKRGLASLALLSMLLVWPSDALAIPRGTQVRVFKRVPSFPIDMTTVLKERKVFYTTKSGNIRVIWRRRLLTRPCKRLAASSEGERGALGIELHPRYRQNHYLYVFYTKANPLENRVERFTVRHNRCRNRKLIVGGIDASSSGYHNGGQLEFVKRRLFVSTGESHDPSAAQDKSNRLGKILRYNADGSIPKSNPFNQPGDRNPVWSYGHRNPFGLTHQPGTKRIYETENGPQCDDELNRISKGRNYGWGRGYQCATRGVGQKPKRPLRRWRQIIVPTDPWWYQGRMDKLSGDLFVGDFRGTLRRFRLNEKGTRILSKSVVLRRDDGIVDVSKGPRGWLYFMTTSTIYRIVPR